MSINFLRRFSKAGDVDVTEHALAKYILEVHFSSINAGDAFSKFDGLGPNLRIETFFSCNVFFTLDIFLPCSKGTDQD